MVQMSQSQVQEITMGLLESQQLFVWVMRDDIVNYDRSVVLPEGFLEKIKDQGLVVPWCSQWYDQYTNIMLIVKQWKVGIELEDHRNEGINVDRGEISRDVKALIIGEEGKTLRKNAKDLREKIRGTTSEGGSLVKNLESFVDFLARKEIVMQGPSLQG
eukprot:Gb_01239 [translate_table: standard]